MALGVEARAVDMKINWIWFQAADVCILQTLFLLINLQLYNQMNEIFFFDMFEK